MNNRKLVLENGKVFEGVGFGSSKEVVAEMIYNTSVVGYQEIISDPTNCNKIICFTYPLIGNYGLTDEDYESKHICTKGLVVREYNDDPSNFRYTRTLSEVMEENDIAGISQIDTRSLMKIIREEGTLKALICDIDKPIEEALEILKNYKEDEQLVNIVASKKVWYSRTPNPVCNVAVIDLGTKMNFIKQLNKVGCNVICFPYNSKIEDILKYKPDGLFISNGPGDPTKLEEVVNTIKSFIGKIPMLGVSLGFELIGLAYGIDIVKMKCGHHGSNYPVKNVITGKVEITTQNHLFTLNKEQLTNSQLLITHENVLNKEVEGICDKENRVIGVQFEPSTPIDEDSENIFQEFLNLMIKCGGNKNA